MVAHRHRHTIANDYLISLRAGGNKSFSRIYFNIIFMKRPRVCERENKKREKKQNVNFTNF